MRILDEAVVDAVRLSHRYISGRQLPDKAVSLLDTAAARVAIGHNATPPADRGLPAAGSSNLTLAIDILAPREAHRRRPTRNASTSCTQTKTAAEAELAALETRWKQEAELVTRIREIRDRLESGSPATAAAGRRPRRRTPAAKRPRPTARSRATAPSERRPAATAAALARGDASGCATNCTS